MYIAVSLQLKRIAALLSTPPGESEGIHIDLYHYTIKPFDLNFYLKNRNGIHLTSDEYYMTKHGLTGIYETKVTGNIKIKILNRQLEGVRDIEADIAINQGYDAIADNKEFNDVYVFKKSFHKLKFDALRKLSI